jgi:endonuclease/exonuclease/phosphatase family metal-dependent hydrolase
VKKVQYIYLNDVKYWVCEILYQPGDNKFDVNHPVNIEDACFKLPDKKNIQAAQDTQDAEDIQDAQDTRYELEEFSDFHHVRLGSWNVACMNGPDIPTNENEYEIKFKNMTDVIYESHCNIVALQELPNELKIKSDDGKETKIRKFEPDIMDTIKTKLKVLTGSEWNIKYHPVNHSIDSLGPGETLDARKNRKEIYAFVYNTSVVRYLHPDQGKTNKVEDRRSLDVRFARCPIISNFCSNKLEFTLCTVHLPPTDKKVKTYKEIQDLGEKVFPGLISTFGEKKAKSVIFLGDFNMGYMQKKKLHPRPTVDTWEKFHEEGYVPCIKTPTNVLQNMHYDNIWMHHSMADLTISKAGDSNTGVIRVNEIEGTPFVIGSTLAEGFKKRVSDHNLVYVDLRSNEVMPWSSSNVVLKRDN